MELFMCSIKDRALDAFLRPFFVPHRNLAIRGFTDEVNRVDGDMFKHPEDYDLYFLGVFDDVAGVMMIGHDRPNLVVRGQDVKREVQP